MFSTRYIIEKISFIVSRNHPFSERSCIDFEELFDYPLIVGGTTCLYYLRLAKQFSQYTQSPFLYSISQISAIPGFVKQLSSVGAVLDSTPLPPGVVKINVELNEPTVPVGLLQLRSNPYPSASKNALIQLIKEELAQYTRE